MKKHFLIFCSIIIVLFSDNIDAIENYYQFSLFQSSLIKPYELNIKIDSLEQNVPKDTITNLTLYSDVHLLIGAELTDPFHPRKFLVDATRIWKTDIRFGFLKNLSDNILSFFSIRDNDSPNTNNINLYEVGFNINYNSAMLWIGQRRTRAGERSYYLNDIFERYYWDKGLIYDFLIRGIGTSCNISNHKLELFLGADQFSYFIGGGNFLFKPLKEFVTKISALYVTRDEQYSAFGSQYGLEMEESYKCFWGYQVIGYKNLKQEPSDIKELTLFAEGRLSTINKLIFSSSILVKRFIDRFGSQSEIRTSADIRYNCSRLITTAFQIDFFRVAKFSEIQLCISAYFNYLKNLRFVPKTRYIITEYGPNIGFIGLECSYNINDKLLK